MMDWIAEIYVIFPTSALYLGVLGKCSLDIWTSYLISKKTFLGVL